MPSGVYPRNDKYLSDLRENTLNAKLFEISRTLERDLDLWAKLKNAFGEKKFKKDDTVQILSGDKIPKQWISIHNTNSNSRAFLCFLEKATFYKYKVLKTPVLKSKFWIYEENREALKSFFWDIEILDSIIDESIKYHITKKETLVAAKRKAVTQDDMDNTTKAFNKVFAKSYLQDLVDGFSTITNIEKADIACLLNPLLEKGSVLAKYNELYPNYAMPNVKRGDMIFHPIAGKKEVVEADERWIYFYGNGNRWKCDRDGYIDGDHSKPRSVWTSFDSYAKEMNR